MSLREQVVQALRDLERTPSAVIGQPADSLWAVHEAIARAITTLSDGLARARTRSSDRRRHRLLLSSAEAAEVQATLKAATDANARLRAALVSSLSSVATVLLTRADISELKEALAACVEPATSLDRCLRELMCQPDVKDLNNWRAWKPELVSFTVLATSVAMLILLSLQQKSAAEKLRKRAEGLLATQVAAAGRLVHRSPSGDSTLKDDSARVRLRALRAAHHMLHDARVDLSTILLQRFVTNEDDERRRHLRLNEMGLALDEAESVAKQLGSKGPLTGAELRALMVDYRHLLDSVSKGLADSILFPMGNPNDSLKWRALEAAARELTIKTHLNPIEKLLSTHGPLEILARMLFALLLVAIGGSLIQLLSRMFGLIDAKSQIEKIIEGHSSGLAGSIASSLTALAPLGLAAGLATGYSVSMHAAEPTAGHVQTITSVMVSIDTAKDSVAQPDTLTNALLRSVDNLQRTVESLKTPFTSLKESIDSIERNAR